MSSVLINEQTLAGRNVDSFSLERRQFAAPGILIGPEVDIGVNHARIYRSIIDSIENDINYLFFNQQWLWPSNALDRRVIPAGNSALHSMNKDFDLARRKREVNSSNSDWSASVSGSECWRDRKSDCGHGLIVFNDILPGSYSLLD